MVSEPGSQQFQSQGPYSTPGDLPFHADRKKRPWRVAAIILVVAAVIVAGASTYVLATTRCSIANCTFTMDHDGNVVVDVNITNGGIFTQHVSVQSSIDTNNGTYWTAALIDVPPLRTVELTSLVVVPPGESDSATNPHASITYQQHGH